MRFCIVIAKIYCSLLFFTCVNAQNSGTASLSQIHIGIGSMPVINFKPVNFHYTPTHFTKLSAGVNYLKGYVKLNVQYSRLNSDSAALYPLCNMFDNSVAYLHYMKIFKNTYFFAGGQVGLNAIFFNVDGTNLSSNRSSEIEMSCGLELGIEYKMKEKIGILSALKTQRIFSEPMNNLVLLEFGLVYYFNPKPELTNWLK